VPDVKLSPSYLAAEVATLKDDEYAYVVGWLSASDPTRPIGQALARALAAIGRRRAEQGS